MARKITKTSEEATEAAPAPTPIEELIAGLPPVDLVAERIIALEQKVQALWDTVVFLGEHPHYRIGDYINEKGL